MSAEKTFEERLQSAGYNEKTVRPGEEQAYTAFLNGETDEAFKLLSGVNRNYLKAYFRIGEWYSAQNNETEAFCYFKMCGDKFYNNVDVCKELERRYREGIGAQKDESKAKEWSKKADEIRIKTLLKSAHDYEISIGKCRNKEYEKKEYEKKAFECYEKAAELGSMYSCEILAHFYICGIGTGKNDEKAIEFLLKAHNGDAKRVFFSIANFYSGYNRVSNYSSIRCCRYGIKNDYKKAFEYYLKAAELGHTASYEFLKNICDRVIEAPEDDEKVLKQLMKVGYSRGYALYCIAEHYLSIDNERAVEYYTKASEYGCRNAAEALGYYYEDKCPVDKEDEELFEIEKAYYSKHNYSNNKKIALALDGCGFKYQYGDGDLKIEKDEEKAFRYYKKADELGDYRGKYTLAKCYIYGRGTNKDEKKAIDVFMRRKCSVAEALYKVAELYRYDNDGNEEKAFEYYRKAAELGHVKACQEVAYRCFFGTGTDKSEEKALDWLIRSGKSEEYALGRIARWYGKEKNEEKAFEYYLRLADTGNIEAYRELARRCKDGIGTEKDDKKAEEWLEKIENSKSWFKLASRYDAGRGVEVDKQKAAEYYKKAAELGNAKACYRLGVCYYDGAGVPKDDEKAFAWFKKAAERNYSEAQYQTAMCCKNGIGTDKDNEKALYWFTKAAGQRHSGAQYELAMYYLNGEQNYRNAKMSEYWLKKAARYGNKDAENLLNKGRTPEEQCAIAKKYFDDSSIDRGDRRARWDNARQWYYKAAIRGCTEAQYELGCLYINAYSDGPYYSCEKYRIGKEWLKKAAENGSEKAKYRLDNL